MNVAGQQQYRGRLMTDEPMSRHTSWRLGGPADHYYVPADLEDLQQFMADLDADIDVLWIGLGSNLLVRDGGIRGQVIAPTGCFEANSPGRGWQSLRAVRRAVARKLAKLLPARKGLAGAEFFAGIPGTVGGALAMNAGAFGGETWECGRTVEIMIDRPAICDSATPDEFEVGYRQRRACRSKEWFVAADVPIFRATDADADESNYSPVAAQAQGHAADRACRVLRFGVQEPAGRACRAA